MFVFITWLAFMTTLFAYKEHSSLLTGASLILIFILTMYHVYAYSWLSKFKRANFAVRKPTFLSVHAILVIDKTYLLFMLVPITFSLAIYLQRPEMLNICNYALLFYLIMLAVTSLTIIKNGKKELQ